LVQVAIVGQEFGISEAQEFVAVDVDFDVCQAVSAFYWFVRGE
jgi:hypothetical protein